MGFRIAPNAEMQEKYQALIDRLPEGHENAVSMKTLADSFDMKPAELRSYVLSARLDNVLVLSGQNGFFLPETEEEIEEYETKRRRYLRTAEKALAPFSREVTRIRGGGTAND